MTQGDKEMELARVIAQADFIWDLGEQGVMACSPELAGTAFEGAWRDAKSSTRQKFLHIAQVVIANGYRRLRETGGTSEQSERPGQYMTPEEIAANKSKIGQ